MLFWKTGKMVRNDDGLVGIWRRSWSFLGTTYTGICLVGLGENMKNPSQDRWYFDWYSNQVHLNTREVLCYWCHVFIFQQHALCNKMVPQRWCFFCCKQEIETVKYTIHLNLRICGNKYIKSNHETENKRQIGRTESSHWNFRCRISKLFCAVNLKKS
jgi:hypothetical protein